MRAARSAPSHRVPYGARLFVKEGDTVTRGQRLAEWDPYMRPILTEAAGTVDYEDVVEGASVVETADESTGITKRVVVDWRANPRGSELRPAVVIKDKKGKLVKAERGREARYLLSVDSILSVDPGATVKAGDVLARIPLESAKTRDITGGLPRVAELFEARRPKDHAIIAEISGTVKFGRDYKNKRRIIIEPEEEGAEPVEYLIPKGRPSTCRRATPSRRATTSSTACRRRTTSWRSRAWRSLPPTSSTRSRRSTGCRACLINDKHIEVIVRQMLQKVEITNAGDSDLIAGEQLDRLEFDEINERLKASGRSRRRASRCSSASPRPACRRARSSRPRRSRRPRAC